MSGPHGGVAEEEAHDGRRSAPAMVDGFAAYAPDLAHEDAGYDASYFRVLASLEAGNFWFRARRRVLLRLLARHARQTRDYLEVGCGTGFMLEAVAERFADWRIGGSEILVAGLPFAAARVPRAELFQMDACRMPFRDAYDAIGAYDVLEHIHDDTAALAGIHAALRPGGTAVLSVPQHPALWSAQDDAAHHVRRYARGELEHKLRDAGFGIVWSGSFLVLLLPLMLASRLRPKRAPSHDPFAELRVAPSLDRLLSAAMRIEEILLAAGMRSPVGGSRIVVARKEPSP
jgi:SAM-dependent methyltransferase